MRKYVIATVAAVACSGLVGLAQSPTANPQPAPAQQTQPEAAAVLGKRKAENLRVTGAQAIAAANPGCALQIAAYLDLPIYHPMTLLDHAISGTVVPSLPRARA